MKRFVVAVALAAAMLSVLPGMASPARASVAAPTPRLLSCGGRAIRQPVKYTLSCADAGASWTKAKWKSWGETRAIARAVFWRNDCIPNCANGHTHHYRATITLSKPVRTRRYGRLFSVAVLRWNAKGRNEHERFELAT